jgi:hypothetical protein
MAHTSDKLTERRAGKYPYRIAQPAMPYSWAVAQGKIKDHHSMNKFGYNGDVGATMETIWTGSTVYTYETTPSNVNVKSDSIEDDISKPPAGTGAHTVQIYGLNGRYEEVNEVITMNGQTDVASVNQYLRVFRVVVRSAGNGGANAGLITVKEATNTRTLARVEIGDNQTLMAVWTVPANHEAHMASFYAATALAKSTTVDLVIRPYGEVFQVKRRIIINEIRALATGGGGAVTAGFDVMYDS